MPGNLAILGEAASVLTSADLLNAVAVKLPPFWPDNIETWLAQSKSQFCLKGVTSRQTKFDYVVQSMSQTDAVKALDLIRAPPAHNPYGHLKERLLWMYALTDYDHYEAISSLPFSEDTLPSALMSKMLALLPSGHEACFFLSGAFLQHLLADVRSHLVHDRTMDPLFLALHANEIYQVSSASALNHVSSAPEACSVLAVRAPPAYIFSTHLYINSLINFIIGLYLPEECKGFKFVFYKHFYLQYVCNVDE